MGGVLRRARALRPERSTSRTCVPLAASSRTVSIMPLSWAHVRPHHGVVTTAGFLRVIGHDRTGDKRRIGRRRQRQARRPMRAQTQGPRTGRTTLLLIDADDPQRLTARGNRRWVRLVSRLLASSLDRQLAEGTSPESNLLLAARAHVLVTPVTRRALVEGWEGLLAQARRPAAMRSPRVPLNRESVTTCEPEIEEMVHALLNPLPIPARGTAMASWLLRNGAGPTYNRHRSGEMRIALRQAITHLDPSVASFWP